MLLRPGCAKGNPHLGTCVRETGGLAERKGANATAGNANGAPARGQGHHVEAALVRARGGPPNDANAAARSHAEKRAVDQRLHDKTPCGGLASRRGCVARVCGLGGAALRSEVWRRRPKIFRRRGGSSPWRSSEYTLYCRGTCCSSPAFSNAGTRLGSGRNPPSMALSSFGDTAGVGPSRAQAAASAALSCNGHPRANSSIASSATGSDTTA